MTWKSDKAEKLARFLQAKQAAREHIGNLLKFMGHESTWECDLQRVSPTRFRVTITYFVDVPPDSAN